MMILVTLVLFIVATLGMLVNIIVEVSLLRGVPLPYIDTAYTLCTASFWGVWIPTVIIALWLVKGCNQLNFWDVALRASPKWMKILTGILFCYVLLFRFRLQLGFYSAAMTILYSAFRLQRHPDRYIVPDELSGEGCEEYEGTFVRRKTTPKS